VAFARTAEEAARVARAFEEKTVEKTYLALCRRRVRDDGELPRETFATIDAPLAKVESSSASSFRVEVRPDGKPSVTLWRIIARHGDHALVQCRPKTGRTHQIRAHLAHLGWPIVGDAVYADDDEKPVIHRHALHAHLLRLDDVSRTIRAPVPEDFISACVAVGVVEMDGDDPGYDASFFNRLE
jgi:23S rRNA-/tRNA-specific pseudouridylate synthase